MIFYFQPISEFVFIRAYASIMQNKPNFQKVKITLNPCREKHYGKTSSLRIRQNKPNQSQTKSQTRPGRANFKRGAYAAGRSAAATWREIFLLASGNIRYIT